MAKRPKWLPCGAPTLISFRGLGLTNQPDEKEPPSFFCCGNMPWLGLVLPDALKNPKGLIRQIGLRTLHGMADWEEGHGLVRNEVQVKPF